MTPIRLVLADDHAIVLHGLKRLFEGHPDFRVVECCVDGEGAIAAARDDTCDVLVLDLRMPGRTGLDVLKTLAAEKRRCRTILLTAAISDDDVVEAVRLGASGRRVEGVVAGNAPRMRAASLSRRAVDRP